MDRRIFLPAGFFGALALTTLPNLTASGAEMTETERANVKVISEMVATWDIVAASNPQETDKLKIFFADDCAFRLRPTDTAPARGFDVVQAAIQRGTANGQKIRHELLDRFAKGPVVVMEKLNQFITPEKTRTSHVVAVFLMKDGKIAEWTEYFISAA
ncbi:MAG TPA: nuclear transport factor 2 family protein [Candidatus Saccharimonadales bacterium]|jgi:limonene-1,2-epoxide hydrolase|nr:nuclear transport factor 2 family protein [Candidatus Saccharimonadales bacterium]